MSIRLWCCLFLFLGLSQTLLCQSGNAKKAFTLVIDPGHGGKDPGAIGKITREKKINLDIALEFGRLVEANCPDVRVVYTRKKDVFVTLDGRADIANKAKADLFVSIHTNALPKGRIARGAETYTLGMARADENLEVAQRENSVILVESDYKERYQGFNPRSAESYIMFEFMQDKYMERSVKLAEHVQKEFKRTAGRPDKGVHQAGFLVLRATSMPSVLIEVGYISTPDEERFLNSKDGVRKMGRSIYNAFVNYRKSTGKAGASRQPVAVADETPQDEREIPAPAPVATTPGKEEQADASSPADNSPVIFKVQFLISKTKLKAGDKRFKGLKDVDYYTENGIYRYTCGHTTDYKSILTVKRKVNKLFPDAFVIAMQNGKRVDEKKAIANLKKK